ncbi:MAG: tetratricopeptide repeat protein, partial [Bacteroidota bacterium]
MKPARIFLTLLIFLIPLVSYPQFGKMLKEKAKSLANSKNLNKLKKFTSEKLEAERTKFDSTSFNYSISQSDNASLFAVREKGEGFLKIATNLNVANEDITDAERARRYLDAGEGLYASEKYSKAEALFKLAKLEYELGELTEDVNYLKTLSNLGLLYSTMGRYTAAEEYIIDALGRRKEKLGENSSGYGSSLNNLAVLHKETGRFNEAEQEIKKAVEINRTVHGDESMPYAISLNNEAMLYQDVGRYEDAEALMNKVLSISEKLQSDKSENHQKFLSNLALLYQESGQYELAEEKFNELIKLKERRFGTKHPDYAHLLNNLASLYVEMEKYGEVEELLKKSNDIYENKFGEKHRSYAKGISDLGNFYRFQENYEEAEGLLKNALDIRKDVLGVSHPDYVQSLEDMAILYWNTGNTGKASELYTESLERSMNFITSYFPPMSEAEKTRYWDKLHPRFERFYSFVIDKKRDKPELLTQAYNYHIATKGLLLSSTTKIKDKILGSGDEGLIQKYIEWLDQKETLARYYNYSKDELEEQNVNLDSLQDAANRQEKLLSQQSSIFQDGYKSDNADINSIRSKLLSNEAIVEVIRVRDYNNRFTGDVHYLALVLTSDQTKEPEYALIENGNQLETRYYKYYNNIIHQKVKDEYSYKTYWLPIDALVADKNKIYLSPDGI